MALSNNCNNRTCKAVWELYCWTEAFENALTQLTNTSDDSMTSLHSETHVDTQKTSTAGLTNLEMPNLQSLREHLSALKHDLSVYLQMCGQDSGTVTRLLPVSSPPSSSMHMLPATLARFRGPHFLPAIMRSSSNSNDSSSASWMCWKLSTVSEDDCLPSGSSKASAANCNNHSNLLTCLPHDTALYNFLACVEHALASSDPDYPGMRTGAPPSPRLVVIRRNREACSLVWKEFFRTRLQPLSAETCASLAEPTFNNWPFSDAELLRFVRHFFTGDGEADSRLHLTSACRLPEEVLDTWLCSVYSHYNDVPFHNFKHAFMVTQMMYASIRKAELTSLLPHLDLFVLIFSALCHDLDHPGLNNVYQNNAQTWLSICYNTNSPLENHHCAIAFDLIRSPETNVFVGLTDSEISLAKQLILRCILGTDMAKHTDILDAYSEKLTSFGLFSHVAVDRTNAHEVDSGLGDGPQSSPSTLTYEQLAEIFSADEEARALTLVMLLKMCDISTEIRPPIVSQAWLNCLLEEFFSQADLERATGLPVSPLMDRASLKVAECQCSFLKFGILPLADLLVAVLPLLRPVVSDPAWSQFNYYSQQHETVSSCHKHSTLITPTENQSAEDQQSQELSKLLTDPPPSSEDLVHPTCCCCCLGGSGVCGISPAYSRRSKSGQKPSEQGSTSHAVSFPFSQIKEINTQSAVSCRVGSYVPVSNAYTHSQLMSTTSDSHVLTSNSTSDCVLNGDGTGVVTSCTTDIHENEGHCVTETTMVFSAGVSEFSFCPPKTCYRQRPVRRSLGELPWLRRSLQTDYVDIIAENRYLTPTPPSTYEWLRQRPHMSTSNMSYCGFSLRGPQPSGRSCSLTTSRTASNDDLAQLNPLLLNRSGRPLTPPINSSSDDRYISRKYSAII